MRHYYITKPGVVEAIDEPVPEPGPGELLVRITHTAISPGSNVYIYRTGSYTGIWDGTPQECIYMGSGVVESLGEGVRGFSPDEPVVMNGIGHQEYAVVPARKAHRIPAGVDPRAASLSYLAGWAVSALHLGRYAAGETVAVIGLGLVGASAALVADMMGARVVALDIAPERVAYGRSLGLGMIARAGDAEDAGRVRTFAGERGIDLVLETSGSLSGFAEGFELARDYTRMALMGLYRQPPPPEQALALHRMLYEFPSKFHYKKIEVIGCGYDPEDALSGSPFTFTREGNFAYLLEQAGRGKIALDRLVTDVFPASEVEGVLRRLADGDRSIVGAVFDWH